MLWLYLLLLLIITATIAYQDFQTRSVVWIAFLVLAILGIVFNLIFHTRTFTLITNVTLNLIFLSLQFLLLKFYMLLRYKSARLLKDRIGIGDLVFIVSTTFFFSPILFLIFYTTSLLFSLVAFALLRSRISNPDHKRRIPLAGLQAVYLFLFMTFFLINDIGPVDDRLIKLTLTHGIGSGYRP